MQGTDHYISETNRVSMVYSLAVLIKYKINVMSFPMINVVYFDISTFRSVCSVPSVVVFCSSLTSCFRGVLFVRIF